MHAHKHMHTETLCTPTAYTASPPPSSSFSFQMDVGAPHGVKLGLTEAAGHHAAAAAAAAAAVAGGAGRLTVSECRLEGGVRAEQYRGSGAISDVRVIYTRHASLLWLEVDCRVPGTREVDCRVPGTREAGMPQSQLQPQPQMVKGEPRLGELHCAASTLQGGQGQGQQEPRLGELCGAASTLRRGGSRAGALWF